MTILWYRVEKVFVLNVYFVKREFEKITCGITSKKKFFFADVYLVEVGENKIALFPLK